MNNAKKRFDNEINNIKSLKALIQNLKNINTTNNDHVSDINRMRIVWAISAFDKLIHDILRTGIMEIFYGHRTPTKKYLNEPIPISVLSKIYKQELIPAATEFEASIYAKLKTISYQDPTKLSDGLSFIWDEKQKWQTIANNLKYSDDKEIKQRLSLITTRRNAIVHEADLDPISHKKQELDEKTTDEAVDFLEKLGNAIFHHCLLTK